MTTSDSGSGSFTGPLHDAHDPAITVRGLTKRFGSFTAVDDLDLVVRRGTVHGFLGPNGAGKSTAIRAILGMLKPNAGTIDVLGHDPTRDPAAATARVAYVPGDVELWPNLTGGEAIDLFGRLRGRVNQRRRDDLIDRFDLDPRRKGRTYSKGNRQKVALIAALSADVDLLLLDEPTSGLDPLMEAVFQELIREACARGTTVLLSSHILSQVEALADRISIIRKGRVVETGTLLDMRHLSRTVVTVLTDRPTEELVRHEGIHNAHREGEQVRFDVDAAHLPAVMQELATLGVRALTATPPSLERLLLRHYGDTPDGVDQP